MATESVVDTTASNPAEQVLNPQAARMQRALTNKALFQSYLLAKMPLLAMTGTRIEVLNLEECKVVLPYGWRTKNIFGSMYFGAILMAAESACGSLVLLNNKNLPYNCSPIVKSVEADFIKSAHSDITFHCAQGEIAVDLFNRAKQSGAREEAVMEVIGTTPEVGEVARVKVLWSARMKKS